MAWRYSELAHDEVWVDEHDESDEETIICEECGEMSWDYKITELGEEFCEDCY